MGHVYCMHVLNPKVNGLVLLLSSSMLYLKVEVWEEQGKEVQMKTQGSLEEMSSAQVQEEEEEGVKEEGK